MGISKGNETRRSVKKLIRKQARQDRKTSGVSKRRKKSRSKGRKARRTGDAMATGGISEIARNKTMRGVAHAIATGGLSPIAEKLLAKKSRKMGVRGEAKKEVKSLRKQAKTIGKDDRKEAKKLRTDAKNVAIKWRNEKRAKRGGKKAQKDLDSGVQRGYNRGSKK